MLIGLSGPMYSGKTTAAKMLCQHLDADIIPFAKPLKDIARVMGWNGEKDAKGRRLLQLLGTECGRECISPSIWVDKWLAAAQASKRKFVISDDCRFVNEAELIKSLGGMVIRITGREKPLTLVQKIKKSLHLNYLHRSERPLPDRLVTSLLVNDGNLMELSAKIGVLASHLESIHGSP